MITLTKDQKVQDLPFYVFEDGTFNPTDLVLCYREDDPSFAIVQFQANYIENGVNL